MERPKRDEFLVEKDKLHKRRRDDQDPPQSPPPNSDQSKKSRNDSDAFGLKQALTQTSLAWKTFDTRASSSGSSK
nr:hypothetical protein [Tanacetum cinerariifolium]